MSHSVVSKELGIGKPAACLRSLGNVVGSNRGNFVPYFKKTSPQAIIYEDYLCFCESYEFYEQYGSLFFVFEVYRLIY